MKGLPEASVDAVVCDPPYDLTSVSRGGSARIDGPGPYGRHKVDSKPTSGFMGKKWDGTGISFEPALWAEVFRVLQPGGSVKAFGGTRTFHRMAVAMEVAGFTEVHLESWVYGCLSDDSEILTESGWKLGTEVQVGERVACWDSVTDKITLEPVQETFRGPFRGDLVSFKNDNTDQLLTPNHRTYIKQKYRERHTSVVMSRREWWSTEWLVAEADNIRDVVPTLDVAGRPDWAQIPVKNALNLPLAGIHDGPGIGGEDFAEFLGWIWTEGGFDRTGTGIRIYQSSVNQPFVDAIQRVIDKFAPEHSHCTRDRWHESRNLKRGRYSYTENCWYFSGEIALRVRGLLPGKHPTWDLIWRMTQDEKRAFMWAAIRGDGQIKKGRRLVGGGSGAENYTFYQDDTEDLRIFQALCHLTNRQGRINTEKYSVCIHNNPVTQLQSKHLKASVSVPYNGEVWCVRVPTGAFVARRNDLVFITGNSGFPKSLNVGKALDKMAGAIREKKRVPYTGDALMRTGGQNTRPWMEAALKVGYHELAGDDPATDDAKLWNGWGTALKPAWEPVLVGTKPV
jgi:hypothetical protein